MSVVRDSSHWNQEQIRTFLDSCVIPVRIASLNARSTPLVSSLWFMHADHAIWCATNASSAVAQYLRERPACGFEIAPDAMPYRGVRGQGLATLSESQGMEVLLRLMDRYLGTRETPFAQWLIKQATDEVAIRIDPEWLTAWDFSSRMGS